MWTEEALAELDKPKYEYDGKLLTEYEASQIQRYNERQIRRWKREEIAMNAAGLDSSETAAKVKYWQGVQADFVKQTGFARQYEREQITVAKSQKYGIIKMSDIQFGISLGAKAKNYDVLDLSTGEMYRFVEGTRLQNVEVFAGKGSNKEYRNAEKYANRYGGRPEDWQHCKGFGWLETLEGDLQAEVHWSQCEGIGKHDFFVKRWIE